MHGQTEGALIFLITVLLIVWIVIEREKLREMAAHDKSKLAILLGVAVFVAILNSIVFSWLSMVILDSIDLDRVIGNFGMFAAMVMVPLIPSGLISAVILENRRWVYLTTLLTLVAGLYLILSCFYCFGG